MGLSAKDKLYLLNLQKGFLGEKQFDKLYQLSQMIGLYLMTYILKQTTLPFKLIVLASTLNLPISLK